MLIPIYVQPKSVHHHRMVGVAFWILMTVETVSTSPDIATTGPLENGPHLLGIVSQRKLQPEVSNLVDGI